jgi:23S rRNA-/tRNA-specific pseudouridylate synthase
MQRVKPEITVTLRQCYKNYNFLVNVNGNKRKNVSNQIVRSPNLQNYKLVCASMGRRYNTRFWEKQRSSPFIHPQSDIYAHI